MNIPPVKEMLSTALGCTSVNAFHSITASFVCITVNVLINILSTSATFPVTRFAADQTPTLFVFVASVLDEWNHRRKRNMRPGAVGS